MIEEQRQLASALDEKSPHGYSQLKSLNELDQHAACTVMKDHQVQSRIADGRRMLMHGRYDGTAKLLGGKPQDEEGIHGLVLIVDRQRLLTTSMGIVGLSED